MRKVIFRFGKYRGQLISENEDVGYLKWYYSALTISADKPAVLKRILELDDTVTEYNGQLLSLEDVELIKNTNEDIKNIPIKRYIDVFFERNVDGVGRYSINDSVDLNFGQTKRMSFKGYDYYLPVFNGKGVKIKYKPFRVHIDLIQSEPPFSYKVLKLESI